MYLTSAPEEKKTRWGEGGVKIQCHETQHLEQIEKWTGGRSCDQGCAMMLLLFCRCSGLR